MDSNMSFHMDADVKAQMTALCAQLGMTPSTAFNLFANAFVRAKGMPFAVTVQEPLTFLPMASALADADQILTEYEAAYPRMAE